MQKTKPGVVRRLMAYLRPRKKTVALALLLAMVVTVSDLMRPVLVGNAMDSITAGSTFSVIVRYSAVYMGILVLGTCCNAIELWILQKLGQDIILEIRQQLFRHIHSLSLRFFDITPVGRIVTRVTNDVETLNELFSTILVTMVKNAVLILGYAGVMLYLNWKLALVSFILLPLVVYLTRLFTKLYRTTHRITRTKVSAMNTYLSENLSAMKLIQVFHREREKQREFRQRSGDLFQSNFREIVVYGTFRPVIYFISILALASVLGFGGKQVMDGALSIGTLYIFTSYVKSFFEPIQSLSDQFGTLQSAMAAGEKIFTLMDEEPQIRQPENPKPMPAVKGRIEFEHVWFSYDGEEWVLRDVSFVIEPGQTAAFVGATGAGKSSILNLIGRYYDIQKGRITLDGVDIRELDLKDLRRAIGQVQQDVFLFTGDIQGNIRLREDEISDGKVREAAKFVGADSFIDRLEQGYETAVTERGSTLSAGQRQLLSFARTLAFDPNVLVMDEATANIDTETEGLIQEAMAKMMQGRTTIVVAHRLSTIQHADQIMVMHHGQLREQGTHQELLAQNGIYKKLYDLQRRTV
ncbi:MAG: ABC transporter ATP-binding protein [Oscillospiraceae bacterium]|nr:ABC transporter ATP-binding protein [Oscillospiraceae bacterium]